MIHTKKRISIQIKGGQATNILIRTQPKYFDLKFKKNHKKNTKKNKCSQKC